MGTESPRYFALRAHIEACRDLGRGSISAAGVEMLRGVRRVDAVPIEDALDIFDRQIDNILGFVGHLEDSGGVSPQDRPAAQAEPGGDPVGTDASNPSGVPTPSEPTTSAAVTWCA